MAIKYKWLTEQLRDLIQEYIQNGRNRLPAEQELCARYRVSRQTVRAALAVLEESQEIRRIKGSGSYITGLSDQESRNVIGVLIPDEQQYQYPAFVITFAQPWQPTAIPAKFSPPTVIRMRNGRFSSFS